VTTVLSEQSRWYRSFSKAARAFSQASGRGALAGISVVLIIYSGVRFGRAKLLIE
jgi:hypothetical protein